MHGTRDSFIHETPDIYVRRLPTQLLTAQAYFVAKNRAACKGPVKLAPGDTWDALADRLGERFGAHIWHPCHWNEEDSHAR